MIRYLLDTNAIITLLNGRSRVLQERLEAHHPDEVAISAVTAFELYFGAFKSAKTAFHLETLRQLFDGIQVLDLDRDDGRVAGEIRASLGRRGSPIGPYDVLIAGQAKARGLVVVTNNISEFQRIEQLGLEDWSV